jgi:hypothetical protein
MASWHFDMGCDKFTKGDPFALHGLRGCGGTCTVVCPDWGSQCPLLSMPNRGHGLRERERERERSSVLQFLRRRVLMDRWQFVDAEKGRTQVEWKRAGPRHQVTLQPLFSQNRVRRFRE